MAITTNMNLDLPTVSTTLGPEWASDLNTAFEAVDEHDHSTGKGLKISPAGMDITSDLDMQDNDLQNALTLNISSGASVDTAKTSSLQRVGQNLYWVNSSGTSVQITSGSSIVSPGSGAFSVSVPGSYPYSVVAGDDTKVLIVDTTSARTLNLPAATTQMHFIVKDGDNLAMTNNISVVPDGSDTIDGSNSTYTIDTDSSAFHFISDGVSAWYIL